MVVPHARGWQKLQTLSRKSATQHQKAFRILNATLLWHPQTPLMSSACFCLASAPSGTLQGVGTSADSWSNTQPPWSPLRASFIRASCVSQSCQLDKSTDSVSYAELGPRWMIYRCLKTFLSSLGVLVIVYVQRTSDLNFWNFNRQDVKGTKNSTFTEWAAPKQAVLHCPYISPVLGKKLWDSLFWGIWLTVSSQHLIEYGFTPILRDCGIRSSPWISQLRLWKCWKVPGRVKNDTKSWKEIGQPCSYAYYTSYLAVDPNNEHYRDMYNFPE